METVRLRCPECGGTMEVDADREILSCPYCGSKRLVDVSDDVRIAKIYSEADVRREQIRADRDVRREKIRNRKRIELDPEKVAALIAYAIAMSGLLIMMAMLIFSD